MNRQERIELLEAFARLAVVEAENVDPVRSFLPRQAHCLALKPQVVVVRGTRGAGKSALFRVIESLGTSAKLRNFFGDTSLQDARWLDGFAEGGMRHPSPQVLDELASSHEDMDLRSFWMGHLLRRLILECEELAALVPTAVRSCWDKAGVDDPTSWVPMVREQLGAVSAALDAIERHLSEDERKIFVAYDHLDRLGMHDRELRRRWISTLLALWLSLSNRYSHLRAKVFLREDLFDAGKLRFADATKLRPRSVSIEWDVEDLYRVVVRHLCYQSQETPRLLDWLRNNPDLRLGIAGLDGVYGLLPGDMPEEVQRSFLQRFAGDLMGKGVKKGYTYRWIPNHLQDAHRQVVPRSMLNLFAHAAERGLRRPLLDDPRLLTPLELQGALEQTSKDRVEELKEEYPIVVRLENLRGERVLMERGTAERLLAQRLASEEGDLPEGGAMVVDELLDLGVLKERDDGRLDVPDIYRYGYGIRRKGGVARPR